MPEYPTKWLDYRLPTGKEFAVAVCGYSGRIRHMTLGTDPIRRKLISQVNVDGENCSAGQHCLDLECQLNKTPYEHLAHMLDMPEDEPVDTEIGELWGKESTVECFLELIRRMNRELAQNAEVEKND